MTHYLRPFLSFVCILSLAGVLRGNAPPLVTGRLMSASVTDGELLVDIVIEVSTSKEFKVTHSACLIEHVQILGPDGIRIIERLPGAPIPACPLAVSKVDQGNSFKLRRRINIAPFYDIKKGFYVAFFAEPIEGTGISINGELINFPKLVAKIDASAQELK